MKQNIESGKEQVPEINDEFVPSEILTEWYNRVTVTQVAHYLSATRFHNRKYWLGIPALILTTVVGTSFFITLQERPEIGIQIILGLMSLLASVLAALQTFLNYQERSEKHRISGAKYGALGRELEELLNWPERLTVERIQKLRISLDALALESPNIPKTDYSQAGAGKLKALSNIYQVK